ncbi:Pkinase-domain-containing protein [Marasmius fiardii PR-910]|nr:Pkinase-domain-containing protein [Marasmius fiardii PR-910]
MSTNDINSRSKIYSQQQFSHSYSATSSPSSSHPTPLKSAHKSQNTYPPYSDSSSRLGPSPFNLDSSLHSPHFPRGHQLNAHFVRVYQLEDELGSGGYGFVMTAKHRRTYLDVAVKFIIKEKVPQHAWMEHELYGRLPTEVMLLSVINHENVVKCLDLFEDSLYFYLVQELHGSPWQMHQDPVHPPALECSPIPAVLPPLTPSASGDSLPNSCPSTPDTSLLSLSDEETAGTEKDPKLMTLPVPRPTFNRRASHDLFECIEQSEHKRLTEDQARYVFAQIVDAVHYLDSQGVAHRDIKDENIVIDSNLAVKLIDFGSATFVDPSELRPYYTLFYGTTAYASSEILLKKPYQAAPAEVWTLGVLLSFLLTGSSPFPTVKDAIAGRIGLTDWRNIVSRPAMSLMRHCLDPDPKTRATIAEIKAHPWLHGQL